MFICDEPHITSSLPSAVIVTEVGLNPPETNIFLKLDVKRRTQAVQRAKELQLIP
jgi:hypothetical protein